MHKLRVIKNALGSVWVDIGDYRQTIFLAGTGRSGTTWVQNVINYDGSYRVLFEPFHAHKLEMLRDWQYRQYLREDNREERFVRPAQKILSGRVRHTWIDQFHAGRLVWTRRVIKDIRANLLLKWIKSAFCEIPLILIRNSAIVTGDSMIDSWRKSISRQQVDRATEILRLFG